MRVAGAVCAMAGVVLLAGCGWILGPKVITEEFEGRDIDLFAVNGEWAVYSWSPPNNLSRPIHLVVRNLATGEERELEADWYGRGLDVDGSTLVYTRKAGGGPEVDLLAYDLESGSTTTITQGGISSGIAVSGGTVAWGTRDAEDGNVIAYAPTRGGYVQHVEDPGRPENASDTRPRLSGTNLVFLRQDLSTRQFTLMHHDVRAGTTEALPVRQATRFLLDVSDDWVVYSRPEEGGVYGFNLTDRTETLLAETPRRVEGPIIRADFVAWVSHVAKEEFTPVAGQPLVDERDFRNLNLLNLGSGRVRVLAENQFMLRSVAIGADGGVYAIVPREPTPGPDQVSDIVRF